MPRVTGGSLEAHRREARARVYDAFARLMYERGYDAIRRTFLGALGALAIGRVLN